MNKQTADSIDELKRATEELKAKARAAGTAAWDVTKATCQQIQAKTAEYSKLTDRAVRNKPYVALGVALGVGILLGVLVAGRERSEAE